MAQSDRLMLAAGACALAMVALGAWLLLGPTGERSPTPRSWPMPPRARLPHHRPSEASSQVVVDVEGAVAQPGLRSLPAGSRLADAITAAGGYGPDVDPPAAAQKLNLATPLADGQQIYVPRLGDTNAAAPAATDGGGAASSGGGLVDLNSATPEELDALPGIGPVTVQKIVAARQEKPFASLDDAVQRGVLNNGQLEKIRDLATAG